jgi:hypothetical protein
MTRTSQRHGNKFTSVQGITGHHIPPLVVMCFIIELLWNPKEVQWYNT